MLVPSIYSLHDKQFRVIAGFLFTQILCVVEYVGPIDVSSLNLAIVKIWIVIVPLFEGSKYWLFGEKNENGSSIVKKTCPSLRPVML